MRLGDYTRLSKDHLGTETATKRQHEACVKWARQNGHKLAGSYRDSDLSAFKKGTIRPDFQRLLADIEARTIQGVVVWRSDRFTRQPREIEAFLDLAERTGARIFSVTEPFDDSAMGIWMLRNFVNQHNFESAVKSERLRAKMAELRAEGKKTNGGANRPFGYDDDRITVRPDEANLIRLAVDRVAAGETLYSICKDWNDQGVTSPGGGKWWVSTLERTLIKGRTAGLVEHDGKIIGPATWPAIITPDARETLIALLDARKRSQRGGQQPRSYLLTGVLVCGRCGTRLIGRPSHGATGYICISGEPRWGCGKLRAAASGLEDDVAKMMFARLARRRPKPARTPVVTADKIRADLADIEARQVVLAETWAQGDISDTQWAAARRKLDEQTARLRAQLAGIPAPVTPPDAALLAFEWPGLTVEQKRPYVDLMLESVQILPAGKGVRWSTARIGKVVWKV